ncbi:MAG: NAD(P)-binding domain-containing protein [Vulcanimicrobiaceae bacterium]
MMIGIVGTTPKATKLARLLARTTTVTLSDPRFPKRAQQLAEELGGQVSATTPYHQAMVSDVLILALEWPDLDRALMQLGPNQRGVVVDAMLPDSPLPRNGALAIARKLDSRHVVEAFLEPEPWDSGVSICSDDPIARGSIASLLHSCGIEVRDEGPLADAARNEQRARAAI